MVDLICRRSPVGTRTALRDDERCRRMAPVASGADGGASSSGL
jgi:hypothetical protein